jgi:hypothetical protein
MKRLSAITVALMTIAATPVQANELDYALAYEAKINDAMELVQKYNWQNFQPEKRLQSRLYADRDRVLDEAGRIKADMCKVDDDVPYIRDRRDRLNIYYAKLPDNATNKLDRLADIQMLLTLSSIPCDK